MEIPLQTDATLASKASIRNYIKQFLHQDLNIAFKDWGNIDVIFIFVSIWKGKKVNYHD